MSTLAAGQSTTVSLAAGQELYFPAGGAGVAVIASGQAAGQSYQVGNSRVAIGPFAQTVQVSISATAALAYFGLADNPTLDPPLQPAGVDPATGQAYGNGAPVSGAGVPILNAATAGQDSGWITYYPGMRLAYALDSGSTSTTFSVDISNDGATSLGQAFTGTWAATTSEISPPLYLTNTQARYIRFNVLTGGPLSVIKF
jgi:hypothetical protein